MATVELRGISKVYPNGHAALADVDLTVADGELLAVVGPSGSGKSTLLRLISGLERPTAGEVWIGGRRADRLAPSERGLAMVFQNQAPYPHLNVFENLAFGLRARRRPRDEVRTRVEEVAALLGLSALLRRRPAALSGGERQRVALGRALAVRPAVLLLDEPFSNLDAPLRLALREELADLLRRLAITALHVTHDQAEAMALGRRLAVLDAGRLAQVGSPDQVYRDPANRAVAQFIGNPPMNLLPVEVRAESEALRLVVADAGPEASLVVERHRPMFDVLTQAQRPSVLVGVRPEHVQPAGDQDGHGLPMTPLFRESFGHESWLVAALGPHRLRMRLAPDAVVSEAPTIRARLDLDSARLFDALTGEVLGPVRSTPTHSA